jgi:crossover junction endodeoxyribonuclease RusA
MTIEIEFPLEFVVEGTAVSSQAKRRDSTERWKRKIVEASRSVLPEAHFATGSRLAVTLFYFPVGQMQGDLDNIVKPILDAMNINRYRSR